MDHPTITRMERFGDANPFRHDHHERHECECGATATVRHKFGRMLCIFCAREEEE